MTPGAEFIGRDVVGFAGEKGFMLRFDSPGKLRLLRVFPWCIFEGLQSVFVSLEIIRYPGVENFLAVSATNHAVSHIQLGFSDAKQCVAIRAFNLHDETLAQSGARLILHMLVQADTVNAKTPRRKERKDTTEFFHRRDAEKA
jgi:hypothetical protein